ncbi:hypothetical protein GGS23DRAFT_573590 [Durotheca rogersii]|uniref:uncharacterized protein n=1 Tax=Durotheca rogersii TaxID=419775 RepID=UPI00221F3C12|nr:uncharacterized protein GGS23DRAFT_573590 [Durotheca rogersii]KAI5861873.1 hypothetical protein GGS23DRAFT_573590 [Durotheca rogersii]
MFVQPIPSSEIREIMDKTQPWLNHYGTEELPTIDDEMILNDYERAGSVWHSFETLLSLNQDYWGPGLFDVMDWEEFLPRGAAGLSRRGDGWNWQVQVLLAKWDSPKSHITCFLADASPLREMVLSNSELWTIQGITTDRLLQKPYQHHRTVPVTILSCSGCQLRVTQGYVDTASRRVRVRMTPIVDLRDGKEKMWEEILHFLGWFVGEPVGDTLYSGAGGAEPSRVPRPRSPDPDSASRQMVICARGESPAALGQPGTAQPEGGRYAVEADLQPGLGHTKLVPSALLDPAPPGLRLAESAVPRRRYSFP